VAIVTKHAHAALAVPTSAVITAGTRHFVRVLAGGSPTETAVSVGVVGDQWTEITSGLHQGQQVVLADVSAALPNSATASTNGTNTTSPFGGLGGFGRLGGAGTGGGAGGFNRTNRND
jgi:hypothetical protein